MKWLLAMLLAAAPAAWQERADVPYSWARHKPGTFKKTKMTTFGMAAAEQVHTLKEVTEKEVILDVVTINIPTKERTEQIVKLSLFRPGGDPIGEETLKLKGKDYKCRILKGNYEGAGIKVEGKYWVADGLDFPLKTVEVSKGAETWMNLEAEMVLVSLEEELVIAGRKLKCAKFDGKSKGTPGGTFVMWMCKEIPGGMARSDSDIGGMKMVMETVEFEVKK